MDKLGKIIRKALKVKGMTSVDLGRITELNPRTIDNIIHGKSRKEELLKRLSTVLGIDLLKIEPTNDITNISSNINIDIYNKASNIVGNLIKSENIYVDKGIIDTLTLLAYKVMLDEVNISENEMKFFVKGMIKFGLYNFILNYKTHEEGTKE